MSPAALVEFDTLGMHMSVPSGGTLFFEEQSARSVFILCSGHVKLTTTSREGKTLLVRIGRPGDVLGLSAALSSTPYEITAQAIAPVQVKCFQRKDFVGFIERHIEGSMHATKMLNKEYRAALSDATRLALSLSIAGRVARLFLEMADGLHEFRPRFTLALTHEELASMLGTTRESVTRVISEMKRKQMIAIKGASMTILRRDALELLV
ncbi:MAG TPA: Crp/Fnr family transcriptional regulator [Acidobacteriaceae bacterium]|nr:Crp/Fnr family transcriptional regulator [Acidobacteriaceae bacterium]